MIEIENAEINYIVKKMKKSNNTTSQVNTFVLFLKIILYNTIFIMSRIVSYMSIDCVV